MTVFLLPFFKNILYTPIFFKNGNKKNSNYILKQVILLPLNRYYMTKNIPDNIFNSKFFVTVYFLYTIPLYI